MSTQHSPLIPSRKHPSRRLNRRSFLAQAAALGVAPSLAGLVPAIPAKEQPPGKIGLAAQLFLDDAMVASSQGLERVFHPLKKAGLIQEADGRPWDIGGVSSLVRDQAGLFHMTYNLLYWDPAVRDKSPSIGDDKAHWFRLVPCYAQSDDGIRWRKPVLALVDGPTGFRPAPKDKWKDGVFQEPAGFSRQNNQGCPITSIQDLAQFGNVADPDKRYLVNVVRKDDSHAFAKIIDSGLYFAAKVPDLVGDPKWRQGMRMIWDDNRRGPRSAHVKVAGFDDRDQLWFECDQSSFGDFKRRGGRDIGRWTSKDLKEWSKEELVLPIADNESRRPEDFVEYMTIEVRRVADVWLGFLSVFHGDRSNPQAEMPTQKGIWRKGLMELRLVVSRDAGKTWQRVGGKQVWLPPHEKEDGYDRLVGIATAPVRVKDELWFYYGCWDGDHLAWNRDGTTYYKDRMRVWRTARGVLRWDGYLSLHAAKMGEITTRPFTTNGRRLAVNATANQGAIRAELLDHQGKAVPGFSLRDCEPITGTGVAQLVRWRDGNHNLPNLQDNPHSLRFEIRQADLYGFQFLTDV